jgi:hypothetical protein
MISLRRLGRSAGRALGIVSIASAIGAGRVTIGHEHKHGPSG